VVVAMQQLSLVDENLLSCLPGEAHRDERKRIKRRRHRREANPWFLFDQHQALGKAT
jgi:hypothetical protein